ncbi:MAG: hypothetical protein P8K74_07515, partial [Flavobacteriaceae bacterium]|nr:hypothetical protein [Flavobacteriaceae bacterium]
MAKKPTEKAAEKKTVTKKVAVKKTTSKETDKKAAPKKATTKKAAPKKATTKKAAPKKATTKKAAPKRVENIIEDQLEVSNSKTIKDKSILLEKENFIKAQSDFLDSFNWHNYQEGI